ncbi:MAG: MBOAT family O-acyltransferase [Planctomycetota bacterium]
MDLITLEVAGFVLAAALLCALPLPFAVRRLILLAANAVFLAWFHPLAPLVFLVTSLWAHVAATQAARAPQGGRGSVRVALLCLPLLLPLFLPKIPFLADGLARAGELLLGAGAAATTDSVGLSNVVGARLAFLIGASYFTLRSLHLVLDARRKQVLHLGLLDFLVYNSFFPMLVAGPIERADHFRETYARLGRPEASDLRAAVARIFQGLLKKVVLGGLARQWAAPIAGFSLDGTAPATGEAWLALYAIALYAWFDFAGYSDLAIGAARLFGLRLAENFDNPYLRPSIAEFWRGWHLSLSFWIRDYLFLPLCGRSASPLRPHFAALASMTLCGLWHAPNLGWALWGLAHGLGLSVHQAWSVWLRRRFALKKRLAHSLAFRVLATLLTFHFVALTWTLVSIDPTRLAPTLGYLRVLFGLN